MVRISDAVIDQYAQEGKDAPGKEAAGINDHVAELAGAAGIEALDRFICERHRKQKEQECNRLISKQRSHVTGYCNQDAEAGKLTEVGELADVVMKQRKVGGSDAEMFQVAGNKEGDLVAEGAGSGGDHRRVMKNEYDIGADEDPDPVAALFLWLAVSAGHAGIVVIREVSCNDGRYKC